MICTKTRKLRPKQRAILLALKLAEIEFFLEKTGKRPILLLDDIFSELDGKHRKAVLDVITRQQTIITNTSKIETPIKYKEIQL